MIIDGVVTTVYDQPAKSELTVDHAISSTTITVHDAYPFESTGGQISINGTTYTYTSVDYDLNQLVLSSGLTAAALMDDEVLVVPAGTATWAMITTDDGDEGIRAIVPFSMKDRLPTGIRDEVEQEQVKANDVTGRWEVTSLDEEIVIITGTVFQTEDDLVSGNGVSGLKISDDEVGGTIQFFTGAASPDPAETSPAYINPIEVGSGNPLLEIAGPIIGSILRSKIQLDGNLLTFDPNAGGTSQFLRGDVVVDAGNLSVFGGSISTTGGTRDISAGGQLWTLNPATSGTTANCRIGAGGALNLITSVRRNKLDIRPITREEIEAVLYIEPTTFYDRFEVEENGGSEGLRRIPGVIAEQVEEVAPLFATYDDEGELQGVAYDRIATALIPIIRDQQARIEALEEMVQSLTSDQL